MSGNGITVRGLEEAVWSELSKRRWFGKHVEEEEIARLETDIRAALTRVVENAGS